MSTGSLSTAHLTGLTTALAGRYRLGRALGAGGMATVWLAEDLRHGRRVAIKVLHPELSSMLGPERFLKEIELTASLQHPHILPLFDSGSAEGLLYYVMPFVDGETLRARLERERQLPVADALRIATEVADALDYAHRHGVIHRDVKPENILLHDGHVVVTDFGIALAVQHAGGQRMTQTGLSLGTPQYMAPEQAMGERAVDHRADVYALGAVAYEMLAGEPPFAGPSAQAIVARAMTEQPRPLAAQRRSVPPHVEAAVMTALEKLPADRFASAREFAETLAHAGAAAGTGAAVRTPVPLRMRRPVALWSGWLVAGAASAAALWGWLRPRPEPTLPPSRLAVLAPGLGGSGGTALQRQLALTPDGGTVLYVASDRDGRTLLMRHSLAAITPTPVPGVSGSGNPLVSPDGRWLIASVWGQSPSRYPIDGGAGEPIPTGGYTSLLDLGDDGTIWFSPRGNGLARLGADDSVRSLGAIGEGLQLQQLLPGGRLALVVRRRLGTSTGPVALLDLETGEQTVLVGAPTVEARHTAGLLVYTGGSGRLDVVPLDLERRRIVGSAVTVATDVALTGTGSAQFAVAPNGTLAYIVEEPRALVLVDRSGMARPALAARHNYHRPAFSRDGRRLAVDFNTAEGRDVWILSLDQGTLSRATFDRDGHDATWAPDGGSITYIGLRGGATTLFRVRPARAEPPESLVTSPTLGYTGTWLRDGSALLSTTGSTGTGTGPDVVVIRNGGRGPVEPLIATRFLDAFPAPSPDDRWLAYVSDQSGRQEVYVRPLRGDGEQVQVSRAGGTEPVWSRDGRELFYRALDDEPRLVAAAVRTDPQFAVTSHTALFSLAEMIGANPHANYDVSPDGRTFAMVRRSPTARIMVIQNLPALVARLGGGAAAPDRRGAVTTTGASR